jgi:hypothetical protein
MEFLLLLITTPVGLYSPHPLQKELFAGFLSPHLRQIHVGPLLEEGAP